MRQGKIARILSDTEVVINLGSADGVLEGQEFVIYSEGPLISDPDTGEELGHLEMIKARVVVSHVMERISEARTKTYSRDIYSPLAEAMTLSMTRTETRHYSMRVEKVETEGIDRDTTVRKGDLVRAVD